MEQARTAEEESRGRGQSLLRRKLVSRKRAAPPPVEGEGAADAVPAKRTHPGARALSRACAAIGGGVHASARLAATREVGQAELLDLIEPDGFLCLLSSDDPAVDAGEGAVDRAAGLLALDRVAFMALGEILTTRGLTSGERPPRRATHTDAALLADFIDGWLRMRRQEVQKQDGTAPDALTRWVRGTFVSDARLLPVQLEEGAYRIEQFDFTLTLGAQERKGQVLVGVPLSASPPAATGADTASGPPAEGDMQPEGAQPGKAAPGEAAPGETWRQQLEAMVMAVPARLDAVLGRVSMPLDEVLQLTPGSRLTLPLSQLEEVRLESADRRLLALARLGQYRSMRALRLTSINDTVSGLSPSSIAALAPATAAPPATLADATAFGVPDIGETDAG